MKTARACHPLRAGVAVAFVTVATAIAGVSAAPAWADPGGYHTDYRAGHPTIHERHVHVSRVVPSWALPRHADRYFRIGFRPFAVPRRITRATFEGFAPYFRGTTYHRGHGHYHSVYDFPVRTANGWVHELHYYCRGELYF